MQDLDARPLPLGVEKRAGGEPLAQERVGVEAALRIWEQVELEPADFLAAELVGQRRVAVGEEGVVDRLPAEDRVVGRALGLRELAVVAVVRPDHLDLVHAQRRAGRGAIRAGGRGRGGQGRHQRGEGDRERAAWHRRSYP